MEKYEMAGGLASIITPLFIRPAPKLFFFLGKVNVKSYFATRFCAPNVTPRVPIIYFKAIPLARMY